MRMKPSPDRRNRLDGVSVTPKLGGRSADPEAGRMNQTKVQRNEQSKSPTSWSTDSSTQKDHDMIDKFPQYIGRHGMGIVVMVKDSFGFVKCVDETLTNQLFFHVSEVVHPKQTTHPKPDLRTLFKAGDEIEFTIEPSKYNDGRLHAKQVKKLKAGTIMLEELDIDRRKGTVQLTKEGDMFVEAMTLDGDGKAVVKSFPFSLRHDIRPGKEAPGVGDVVEFFVATDRMKDVKKAKDIEVIAKASSEGALAGLKLGSVIKLSEEGGEIRQIDTCEEVPFNKEDMQLEGGLEKLTLKCEVAFSLKDVVGSIGNEGVPRRRATNVVLLPTGTITSQQSLGQFRGKLLAMPTINRNVPADGSVQFEMDGAVTHAAFSCVDVHEFISSLNVGDDVEFELVKNKFVSAAHARNVTLLLKHTQPAELGRVSVLKKNFGFIKCCSRVADLFFHVNALLDTSPPLAADSDVSFVPVLDPKTSKLIASQLSVQPAGSAVFEVMSEGVYEGVVKVTCELPRGHTAGAAGIIYSFVDGRMESLPFVHSDLDSSSPVPDVEQQVLFKVMEDRREVIVSRKSAKLSRTTKAGGRRACQVRTASCCEIPLVAGPLAVHINTRARSGALSRQGSFRAIRLTVDSGRVAGTGTDGVVLEPHETPFDQGLSDTTIPSEVKTPIHVSAPCTPQKGSPVALAPEILAAAFAKPALSHVATSEFRRDPTPEKDKDNPKDQPRIKGTVVRLNRNPKKGNGGQKLPPFGIVRAINTGSWSARKREAGNLFGGDGGVYNRDSHDRDSHRLPGDSSFLMSDVCVEHRDSLRINDTVEYILTQGPDEKRAVDVRCTRTSKQRPSSDRGPPPPVPVYPITPQSSTDVVPKLFDLGTGLTPVLRKKFITGPVTAMSAKGPSANSTGFALGRGKPIVEKVVREPPSSQLGRNLSAAFNLSSAISAIEFVPKGLGAGLSMELSDLDLTHPRFLDADDTSDIDADTTPSSLPKLGSGIYRINSAVIQLARGGSLSRTVTPPLSLSGVPHPPPTMPSLSNLSKTSSLSSVFPPTPVAGSTPPAYAAKPPTNPTACTLENTAPRNIMPPTGAVNNKIPLSTFTQSPH